MVLPSQRHYKTTRCHLCQKDWHPSPLAEKAQEAGIKGAQCHSPRPAISALGHLRKTSLQNERGHVGPPYSTGEQHIPSACEATSSASQRSALCTGSQSICQRTWLPLRCGPSRAHCNFEAIWRQNAMRAYKSHYILRFMCQNPLLYFRDTHASHRLCTTTRMQHLGMLRPHRLEGLLEIAGRTWQVVGGTPGRPRCTELFPRWAFSRETRVPAASADNLFFKSGQVTLEMKTGGNGVAVICWCLRGMALDGSAPTCGFVFGCPLLQWPPSTTIELWTA